MANHNSDNWRGHYLNIEPEDWPISRYGQWRSAHTTYSHDDAEYLAPDYLGGSDYSGTLVERSNRDVWRETFSEGEDQWWCEVSGDHGTFAIVVRIADMPDEAREFLDALESYPLADEDHHSRLEMEAQDEAWKSWARDDFRKALCKRIEAELCFDDFDGTFDAGEALDDVDDSQIDHVFWEILRNGNGGEWINEQGDQMWIRVDEIAESVSDDDLRMLAGPPFCPTYGPDRQASLPFDA